jgi:DNA-binding PadR family transcriptional regulator
MDISEHDITTNDATDNDAENALTFVLTGVGSVGEVKESIALTEAVYYILLSLYRPMHGYGIMQNVAALSGGRVNLAAGTLYGAINTLLEKGYITALPGGENSRKKEYKITRAGSEVISGELERLRELVKNGELILGGLG